MAYLNSIAEIFFTSAQKGLFIAQQARRLKLGNALAVVLEYIKSAEFLR